MTKDITEVLKENLSYLLEKSGIARRTLAQNANLSTSVLAFESKNYNPTVKTLQTLAEALHIDWQILFIDHDSDKWRQFEQLSDLATDFRRKIIIDPATHGVLPPCILTKEEIKSCQEKERQYLKRLSAISENLANQNKDIEQSKDIEQNNNTEQNKETEQTADQPSEEQSEEEKA